MNDITQRFLTETEHTGRFIVTSFRTGKKYYIEPIEGAHTPKWGDVNPATGKVEGSYGKKYRGGTNAYIANHERSSGTYTAGDLYKHALGLSPINTRGSI